MLCLSPFKIFTTHILSLSHIHIKIGRAKVKNLLQIPGCVHTPLKMHWKTAQDSSFGVGSVSLPGAPLLLRHS